MILYDISNIHHKKPLQGCRVINPCNEQKSHLKQMEPEIEQLLQITIKF